MTSPGGGYPLLVITSGIREYREYLFRSISSRYHVHLIDSSAPTWERPYLGGYTIVENTGAIAVREAAARIAATGPVAGVMTWHEEHIVQAALAAEDLGLPGPSAAAARRCRDKLATRDALAGRGILQPRYRAAASLAEALVAAADIGYPVVLKPRAAGGSQGVVLVRDAAELADQYAATRDVPVPHTPAFDQRVLVEEYLDGPEISVDSAVYGGQVLPVMVARKETGFAPYFEETGHLVSARDPLLADPAFRQTLTAIHDSLGFTDGWTHAELKLTEKGASLIEVNGRLGGDLIPYLGMRASGIDPGLAAAAIACGQAPALAASAERVAGVRFCYPGAANTLIEALGFDAAALPAEIDLVIPLAKPGDVASPPRRGMIDSRIALVTAVAATGQGCRAALGRAQAAFRLRAGVHSQLAPSA